MNHLAKTVNDIQEILGICPCCGEIFRLAEAKFVFPEAPPKACEYLEIAELERRIANQELMLDEAESRFQEKLAAQKEALREIGRREAKKRLRKIDPVFSGNKIDPQDVKVIFEPIEYVIFHGLSSIDGVRSLEFVSRKPDTKLKEKTLKSIAAAVRTGNVEFETLHMQNDGSFEIRKT